MLFTSFITFTYIPFIPIRSLLLGFSPLLAFVGYSAGDRYKPITRQAATLFPFCSSLQYCTFIAVRLYLHSGTLHWFYLASCFCIASCFSKNKERSKEKRTILYIILYIFFLCILILFTFFWFFSFFSLILYFFLADVCTYLYVAKVCFKT